LFRSLDELNSFSPIPTSQDLAEFQVRRHGDAPESTYCSDQGPKTRPVDTDHTRASQANKGKEELFAYVRRIIHLAFRSPTQQLPGCAKRVQPRPPAKQ
jgi:hypothetical protein